MIRQTLGLAMAATILTALAGCAAQSATGPHIASTPGAYIFGSCPQKPAWPEAALREKRQGAVGLAFLVDADDSVLDAKVKSSSGHPDLDETARVALSKCKFKAATRNGSPVREWVDVRYHWMH